MSWTNRSQCPKCLATEVHTLWVRARSFSEPGNLAKPEHLKITCLRCGYGWETPPADAEQS